MNIQIKKKHNNARSYNDLQGRDSRKKIEMMSLKEPKAYKLRGYYVPELGGVIVERDGKEEYQSAREAKTAAKETKEYFKWMLDSGKI